MKKIILIFITCLPAIFYANQGQKNSAKFVLTNTTQLERLDEVVCISESEIKARCTDLDVNKMKVLCSEKEITYQVEKDSDGKSVVLILVDFKPNQKVEISFEESTTKSSFKARTFAGLAKKKGNIYFDKKYRGTEFENVSQIKVPAIHTDHDALFKYEGPGWESDKVGYRFYLDWRNATDIFGKTTTDLVLENIAEHDTTGGDDDSYHNMQTWGMDIFKVGKSLGIGALGMMSNGKVNMVSKTDSIFCKVSGSNPLKSVVKTDYFGWCVENKKYNLHSSLSINAGSRLTKCDYEITGNVENLATGLAKHSETNYLQSDSDGTWQYIALYGKQSLAGDDLGIAVFYKKNQMIQITEDEISKIVVLKPENGKLSYYFAAAWQQEFNGIKNQTEFEQFLNNSVQKLDNPITVE